MAGATAVTVAGGALRPAAAANGDPLLVGRVALGGANESQTVLKVTTLAASQDSIMAVTDGTTVTTSRRAAFVGISGAALGTGVAGVSTGVGSVGVLGQAETAFGAASNTTHLKLTDASGGLNNLPTTASVLSRPVLPGEVVFDRSFNLWFGTGNGYRKLAGNGSAGAFHIVDPIRVYDSRGVGTLAAATNRIVQITNGGTIPTGARGVLCTLTLTETTGASGFLTITSASAVSTAASSINWFAPGQNLATTVVTALSPTGQVKVWNNSGASSQFIVDVTGYFL